MGAHPPWHFFAGVQYEGEGSWRSQLEQAVLLVVNFCIVGKLAQVGAQQREVVAVVDLANAAHLVHSSLVIKLTYQRVAGVRRNGQQAPVFQQFNGLFEQAWLRVVGVNIEVLRHGF